jgi:ribose transport system ATP-binding protein
LDVAPDTSLSRLAIAQQQMVEIAKSLSQQARILIMDEPTSSLTLTETERLIEVVKDLRTQGVSVIYISHRLGEVKELADRVVALRDGRNAGELSRAEITHERMVRMMVGRDVSNFYVRPEGGKRETAFEVQGLRTRRYPLQSVSFSARRGEILGFAGLVGAGRTEAFEAIIGLRKRTAGRIEIAGRAVDLKSPRDAMRHGLTYLSEDRKGKGLHVNLSLQDNVTLMTLERYAHPLLDMKAGRDALKHAVSEFGIRTGDLSSRARMLSGGNQQKLALAKFLQPEPDVIVLDEPTRGVDVGAKRDIYFLIHRLAAQGRAVIVISSELIELIGLCHRVAVMRAGRLQATLTLDHLTEEELIAHATGTH